MKNSNSIPVILPQFCNRILNPIVKHLRMLSFLMHFYTINSYKRKLCFLIGTYSLHLLSALKANDL